MPVADGDTVMSPVKVAQDAIAVASAALLMVVADVEHDALSVFHMVISGRKLGGRSLLIMTYVQILELGRCKQQLMLHLKLDIAT